jgi:hypothetical protein
MGNIPIVYIGKNSSEMINVLENNKEKSLKLYCLYTNTNLDKFENDLGDLKKKGVIENYEYKTTRGDTDEYYILINEKEEIYGWIYIQLLEKKIPSDLFYSVLYLENITNYHDKIEKFITERGGFDNKDIILYTKNGLIKNIPEKCKPEILNNILRIVCKREELIEMLRKYLIKKVKKVQRKAQRKAQRKSLKKKNN